MKKIIYKPKNKLLSKLLAKICRFLGYEIIDQANFYVPSQERSLATTLSSPGDKSITVPLGQIKITNKINSLLIILRTCTSELIMDQNKKRLFEEEKSEYTMRTINSLISSINEAKIFFKNTKITLHITDSGSPKEDIIKIKEKLKNSNSLNILE